MLGISIFTSTFFYPLQWPIYIFNTVVNTKLPAIFRLDSESFQPEPFGQNVFIFKNINCIATVSLFVFLEGIVKIKTEKI